MNFQEFWKKLTNELKHQEKYRTLKHSKLFEAVLVDSNTIIIKRDSKRVRTITINQFQSMWAIMKNDVRNERYINTKKRYYSFWSSSYVNALIDHVVSDKNME